MNGQFEEMTQRRHIVRELKLILAHYSTEVNWGIGMITLHTTVGFILSIWTIGRAVTDFVYCHAVARGTLDVVLRAFEVG